MVSVEIKYVPHNMKDLLKDMKDTSELMVDLAYSAVFFNDENIAKEVLRLEERMDLLRYHVRMTAMLGARSVDDAELLTGILQIAFAAEKISNAAGDIAKIVLSHVGIPRELKLDLREAEETASRIRVKPDSNMVGKTLGELELGTETGMRVIAIRRGSEWIYDPERDTTVMSDDVLLSRGPDDGVPILYELATNQKCPHRIVEPREELDDLDVAVDLIIDMKDLSELAVGLAYSSVLFCNEEIAREVEILEGTIDNMKNELEHWTLRAAKKVEDVNSLRGLLHLGISSEVISDAALEIADVVLRDIEMHPILMMAISESDEVITQVRVGEYSDICGKSLEELSLDTEIGMTIMAIKRGDRWRYNPTGKAVISAGDVIVAKGMNKSERLLMKMCRGRKKRRE